MILGGKLKGNFSLKTESYQLFCDLWKILQISLIWVLPVLDVHSFSGSNLSRTRPCQLKYNIELTCNFSQGNVFLMWQRFKVFDLEKSACSVVSNVKSPCFKIFGVFILIEDLFWLLISFFHGSMWKVEAVDL